MIIITQWLLHYLLFLLLTAHFNFLVLDWHVYVGLQHSAQSDFLLSETPDFKNTTWWLKLLWCVCECVCVCFISRDDGFCSLYSAVHMLTEHLTRDRDGVRWKCLLFMLLIWSLQFDFQLWHNYTETLIPSNWCQAKSDNHTRKVTSSYY